MDLLACLEYAARQRKTKSFQRVGFVIRFWVRRPLPKETLGFLEIQRSEMLMGKINESSFPIKN